VTARNSSRKSLIPAAGYIRMSSGKQERSPAQQRSEIEKLAKTEGCRIVVWFTDEARVAPTMLAENALPFDSVGGRDVYSGRGVAFLSRVAGKTSGWCNHKRTSGHQETRGSSAPRLRSSSWSRPFIL